MDIVAISQTEYAVITVGEPGPPGPPGGGSAGRFPFYRADGTSSPINLTADTKLPFFLASGLASNIPLVI